MYVLLEIYFNILMDILFFIIELLEEVNYLNLKINFDFFYIWEFGVDLIDSFY